jgi:uncharacterized membrane protein
MKLGRIAKHLLVPDWWAHRAFPQSTLARIDAAIHESEKHHHGELRFVVEGDLHLGALLCGVTPRQRAEELFAHLRVWDTEENGGVLIYVQLIDRDVEIVADRGISAKVPQAQWNTVCTEMQSAFRSGRYEEGALRAIAAMTALLRRHFPAAGVNPDELPNQPVRI